MKPEPTGSKRTEELVEIARKKLKPAELPPEPYLHQYAVLLAAAEYFDLRRGCVADLPFVNAAEEYGIDSQQQTRDAIRKKHHQARKIVSQLAEKAASARATLDGLTKLYRVNEPSLPAALKETYPLAVVSAWSEDLTRFADFVKTSVDRLPDKPAEPGPTLEEICLLWWSRYLPPYRDRPAHIARLLWAWRSTDKAPESCSRRLNRLKTKYCGQRFPTPLFPTADQALFEKPGQV